MKIFNELKSVLRSNTLVSRAAKGTFWIGTGNVFEQVLRLLRNVILTRIIAPEAFGLLAIVLAINAVFESFTQIGIKEAVIQNENGDKTEFLNGAWYLSVGRAILLYLIIYFVSPMIAKFYEQPGLVPLMRVAFLGIVFNGTISSRAYSAIKQMKFAKWSIIFHFGGILGVITTIVLGITLKSEWALVIGFTTEGAFRLILSFILCPFKPRFNFKKEYISSLLKYAKGMAGLPILTFIFMRIDVFVIGRYFSFNNLGLYSMSSNMAWLPSNFITRLVSQVMMPAFSERQKDFKLLNRWTYNVTKMVAYIGFPALAFFFFYGKEFLSIAYGERYGIMAIPFSIIFATAMIRTCSVPIVSVYLAIGKPELHRLFTAIRAILIIILIYPFIKYFGLKGAAASGLIAMIISYFFQVSRMKKTTGLEYKKYTKIFLFAVTLTIPVIIVNTIANLFKLEGNIYPIIIGLIGLAISYLLSLKEIRSIMKIKIENSK